MMTFGRIAASFVLFAGILGGSVSSAFAQPKPGHLDEVLRQMDAASLKFKSAEADFRWDLYEKIVKQTTSQTGTIYFLKEGMKTQMGAKIVTPAPRFIEYKDSTVRLFEPGTDHLTTVTSQKNQAQMESFLTLGFGASGKDLARAWTISDLGTETVDGVETSMLDLVPKDPAVRNVCTHIKIWIDPVRGISLKQIFYTPSEDDKTYYFKNIRMNQKINLKEYAINTDSKTTRD